jgi:hypothetical protein
MSATLKFGKLRWCLRCYIKDGNLHYHFSLSCWTPVEISSMSFLSLQTTLQAGGYSRANVSWQICLAPIALNFKTAWLELASQRSFQSLPLKYVGHRRNNDATHKLRLESRSLKILRWTWEVPGRYSHQVREPFLPLALSSWIVACILVPELPLDVLRDVDLFVVLWTSLANSGTHSIELRVVFSDALAVAACFSLNSSISLSNCGLRLAIMLASTIADD